MSLSKVVFLWFCLLGSSFQLLAQDILNTLTTRYGVLNSLSVNYRQDEIVYTIFENGNWKLFAVQKEANGNWSEVKPVEAANSLRQPGEDIEGSSFSADGTKLYISVVKTGENPTGDIYILHKQKGEWTSPEKLPDIINTGGLEGSPSISSDGNTLFFTRPNPDPENDDYDARFIYISEKDKKGKWKRPYKLPKIVNKDCEFAPHIMPDGKTLVFSSVRDKVKIGDKVVLEPMGGFDLYATTRLAEKIWTEPIHIKQFSSLHNDLFFASSLFDKEFFCSAFTIKKGQINGVLNRKKAEEIKAVPTSPVYCLSAVTKDGHNQAISANYNVFDPYTSQLIASFSPNEDNKEVFISLPNYKNYRLEISSEGYSKEVKSINLKTTPVTESALQTATFVIKDKANLILNVYDNLIYEPLDCRIIVTDANSGNALKNLVKTDQAGIYQISLPIGKAYKILISKKAYSTQEMLLDLSTDIYYFEFERDVELEPNTKELEIQVADAETQEALEVDIVVMNLDKNETIYLKAKRGKNGKFKVKLREGDRYKVKVKNPKGYGFFTTDVDMASRQETSKLKVDLVPLKPERKIELKAITFEYNSSELRQSSYEELKQVIELLLTNPELKVQISAHSDDKGSDSYNLKLSERRAQSVVSFLTEQGLAEEKLVARGFGETRPLVPNDSEQNRAKNRRVELEILDKNQR